MMALRNNNINSKIIQKKQDRFPSQPLKTTFQYTLSKNDDSFLLIYNSHYHNTQVILCIYVYMHVY